MSEVEMNRLILIGNGFDLAHGLKTSFYDFINYCVFEMLNVISEKYKKRNIDNHFLVSNDIVDIDDINNKSKKPFEISTNNYLINHQQRKLKSKAN